ncbi:MAG: flagellar brake protein [Clostridiaceae bacterium]|nr:flagellar brake protein [Clostridiaceae bacterium]
MKYRQIGIGTKIELELYNEKGDKISTGLVSQYESYDEESNMMEIHAPFTQGKIYTVHPGAKVDIIFSKENDIYMFRAEVIDRKIIEPIPMLWVKPVSPIERIERRSFFRMDCRLPILYHVIEKNAKKNENIEKKPLKKCYTRDISGGGVCIVTDTEHKPGTEIHAYITIEREICFVGTVVRAIQVREKGKIMFETGIEYKQIENRDREKIISFVFETQRERLRKGWMMV